MDDALCASYALHPITSDETATLKAMLCPEHSARILLMPTHHISHNGDMMGFRYECAADRPGSALPISRTMFFGHTASECQDDDAAIMRLLAEPERNRRLMAEFLEEVRASNDCPAGLECIPDNSSVGVMHASELRSVDCRAWSPDPPECIGLYHAYIRGFNRDARAHRMFIVCSGGCDKASDEFCNLLIDMGESATAGEIAESEEAWWLRRACQRARCRLIKRLADKFGVSVQCVDDVLAYTRTRDCREEDLLAVPTTDTVEHDIARRDGRHVSVHNLCTDTTRITNGVLCKMHPSEGYWLFRGASRGTGVYGAMFGSHRVCGAFPTRSPCIPPNARHPNTVLTMPGRETVLAGGRGAERQHFVCFDEAHFKTLEKMQWNRDNGFIELIPIVVGVS